MQLFIRLVTVSYLHTIFNKRHLDKQIFYFKTENWQIFMSNSNFKLENWQIFMPNSYFKIENFYFKIRIFYFKIGIWHENLPIFESNIENLHV